MPEESEEERKQLIEVHEKIIELMKEAISDGILTKAEKAQIDSAIQELKKIVEADGVITDSEKVIMEKIDRTLNMILKVEKDFVQNYWKYKKAYKK